MVDKTQKELTRELHQGVYGVPDTDDRGLVGDVKEVLKLIKEQNGKISKNTHRIYYQAGGSAVLLVLIGWLLVTTFVG